MNNTTNKQTENAVEETGPHYWRSLDEMAGKPAFKEWLHREFPEGASEAEGVNRRNFLKIMAASFAMAGMGATGCRRPEQNILPYSKQPEGTIPGIPVYFTTSFPDAKDSLPLVVETHQHRPTHVEGNRDYLPYGGAVSRFASASVLNLYDPDPECTFDCLPLTGRINRCQHALKLSLAFGGHLVAIVLSRWNDAASGFSYPEFRKAA